MNALVLILKTCSPYHNTRLPAALDAWANQFPQRVIATDSPVENVSGVDERDVVATPDFAIQWSGVQEEPENVVGGIPGYWLVKTGHAPARSDAFVQYARHDRKGKKPTDMTDPEFAKNEYKSMPALTLRVANAMKIAYERYPASEWYVFADDDAFLRVGPLRTYLSYLDPNKTQSIGNPLTKPDLLDPRSKDKWGTFFHCGGNGWALSRAAMKVIYPYLDQCVKFPHLTLRYYYDEIQIGRCLHAMLGMQCIEPQSPAHQWLRIENEQGSTKVHHHTLFFDVEDKLEQSLGAVKYHPVNPEMQASMRSFYQEHDEVWIQRFHKEAKENPEKWELVQSPALAQKAKNGKGKGSRRKRRKPATEL